MPRPTKYNEETRKKIIDALKAGCTRYAAAGSAGIHWTLLGKWCKRYSNFSQECAIAEQHAEARFTLIITNAAKQNDPKYALEWLKRRRRVEWGDKIEISKLDDDTLLRLFALTSECITGDAE